MELESESEPNVEPLNDQIKLVMSQTNYDYKTARELLMNNNDPMSIIHSYLGIIPKQTEIKSINQEIFRQMRKHLDISAFNNAQVMPTAEDLKN
jgi:hypothetical protein